MLEAPGGLFRTALCAPMRRNDVAFGGFAVYATEPREWTDEHFRAAEWLAAQCALILEIPRMQGHLRRQADLIDITPDAFIVRALDGTIRLWGGGAEALYGWTRQEAIGRKCDELLGTQLPEPLEVINAAKYTTDGGRISVTASTSETQVTIAVSDTGVGLNPEDLTRVFEMFTQVGDGQRGGLGIGLALVKGLVEMHGGTVEARSDGQGRGSAFIVRLPLAPAPAHEAVSRPEADVRRPFQASREGYSPPAPSDISYTRNCCRGRKSWRDASRNPAFANSDVI